MAQDRQVTNAWFSDHLEDLDFESRIVASGRSSSKLEPILFDLRGKEYIDLLALVNLFLTIDLYQSRVGPIELQLPAIGTDATAPLDVKTFVSLRRMGKAARRLSPLAATYEAARPAYRFLSFLINFGLIAALKDATQEGRVIIPGFSEDIAESLLDYHGVTHVGSSVVPLLPIRNLGDTSTFRSREHITRWLSRLPSDLRASPLFRSGEFAELLGFQLAENISQHAFLADPQGPEHQFYDQIDPAELPSSAFMGAVAMRVVRPDKLELIRSSYPESFSQAVDRGKEQGLLEVVVGDRGIGILGSLAAAVEERRQQSGIHETSLEDCVAFALHPLGSRKTSGESTGGAHALHRVVNSVCKYGGALRIRTDSSEFRYTAEMLDEQLRDLSRPLGLYTSQVEAVYHPFGTQVQLLVPLTPPDLARISLLPTVSRHRFSAQEKPVHIVAAGARAAGTREDRESEELRGRSSVSLADRLLEFSLDTLIVYDFSSGDFQWSTEALLQFISTQKKVLHNHLCIGVGLDAAEATQLRRRELLNTTPEKDRPSLHLSQSLQVSHRLFPIRDTDGILHWFGLGHNPIDGLLTDLVERSGIDPDGFTLEELTRRAERYYPRGLSDDERSQLQFDLTAYLRNNPLLFEGIQGSSPDEQRWECRLTQGDFTSSIAKLVSAQLEQMLDDLGCIRAGGDFYRLPASGQYAKELTVSLPLLQNEEAVEQVSIWLVGALLDLDLKSAPEILLVTGTAPAELLAVRLSHRLGYPRLRVLNLAYYNRNNNYSLLTPQDWPSKAVIVSDVTDSGQSLSDIEEFMRGSGFEVIGKLTLLHLVAPPDQLPEQPPDSPKRRLQHFYWETAPTEDEDRVPHFILAERWRPGRVDAASVEHRFPNDRLYYVESFSLHAFNYARLSREKFREHDRQLQANVERLTRLEDLGALRYGNWVYDDHHFSFTICFERIAQDPGTSGLIVKEIVAACISEEIDYLILPLHSQIALFLPQVESSLRLSHDRAIPSTFWISTRDITDRPFYLLPRDLKDIIANAAEQRDHGRGLNFLILDDALASGRTLQTILRALVIAARSAEGKFQKGNPISRLSVYSILDRQGQAQRTLVGGIRSINLTGDGQWHEPDLEGEILFGIKSWISLELPARDEWESESFQERILLRNAPGMIGLPEDHPLAFELDRRIQQIRPESTESSTFALRGQRYLKTELALLKFPIRTVELGLWCFENFLRQGYPHSMLLSLWEELREKKISDDDENGVLLLTEMARFFFRRWQRLERQWEDGRWLDLFERELERGSTIARALLPEAGRALALDPKRREDLELRIEKVIERLIDDDEAGQLTGSQRENLLFGLWTFAVYYRMQGGFYGGALHDPYSSDVDAHLSQMLATVRKRVGSSWEGSVTRRQIEQIFRQVDIGDSFLRRLITVLDHTVRAKGLTHSHALYLELGRLASGKPLKGNASYLRTGLVEFRDCLQKLDGSYESLFKPTTRARLAYFGQQLEKLTAELAALGDSPSDRVRAIAGRVHAQFPVYRKNKILKDLSRVTVSIGAVIDSLRKGDSAVPIEWPEEELDQNGSTLNETFVLAPSEDKLLQHIRNYTLRARVPAAHREGARIWLSVSASENKSAIPIIRLEIRSNFPSNVAIGRGRVSLASHEFALFGITATVSSKEMTDSDNPFETVILLELPLAMSPSRKERDDA